MRDPEARAGTPRASRGGGRSVLLLLLPVLAQCRPPPSVPIEAAPATLEGHAAHAVRSLDGRPLPPDSGRGFSFLAIGHLYGDPAARPTLPPEPLRRFFAAKGARDDRFVVCLGDLSFDEAGREPTLAWLAGLGLPVFNAPGNHDLVDAAAYVRRHGPTEGHFVDGPALFVFLDTERAPWLVTDGQRALLERLFETAAAGGRVRVAFVFSHRVVFAGDERHLPLLSRTNDAYPFPAPNGFDERVRPLLERAAAAFPVYWFAGDVGAGRSFPLYYEKSPDAALTYVATGLGGKPEDAIVRVRVAADGAVTLAAVPIGGATLAPLESYDLAFWSRLWTEAPK